MSNNQVAVACFKRTQKLKRISRNTKKLTDEYLELVERLLDVVSDHDNTVQMRKVTKSVLQKPVQTEPVQSVFVNQPVIIESILKEAGLECLIPDVVATEKTE